MSNHSTTILDGLTVDALANCLARLQEKGKGRLQVWVMSYDDPGFQDVAKTVKVEGDIDSDGTEIEWVEIRS